MAEPFIGQIMQVGFSYAPVNWALAQGQIMSIAQNSALFSLLGTTFGGDGQVTFGLPDTRGRVMVGVGNGPGLQPVVWGELAGAQNAQLLLPNLPQHTHPAQFTGTPGTTTATGTLQALDVPANNIGQESGRPTNGAVLGTTNDTSGNNSTIAIYAPANAGTPVNLGGLSVTGGSFTPQGNVNVGIAGNGSPFSIMNPFIGMYTLIATTGIYPSRP